MLTSPVQAKTDTRARTWCGSSRRHCVVTGAGEFHFRRSAYTDRTEHAAVSSVDPRHDDLDMFVLHISRC
ncbi:hypothetical protein DPMN_127580 [Dreissena polymorpha]|uniref:Uncharacterized protein n=1 Tax=Dreissena polymorpha TaxID=45954 RepID=A0A9D4GY11_DREPO|nr:hypothetical protein DPMN_127580 [Dreissena polymorpha]